MNTIAKLASVLAIAGSVLSPALLAGPDPDVPSKVVSYDDLDLSKAAGAKTLSRRIQSAARRVCDTAIPRRDLPSMGVYKQCVSESIARAVNDVNAPMLTALHPPSPVQTAAAR